MGQPVNQHAEIIYQLELFHVRSPRQVGLPQPPGQVGDPGLPVSHRTGNGDAGMRWSREIGGAIVEEGLEHRLKGWPFSRAETFLMQQAQLARLTPVESKQSLGASHVPCQECAGGHPGLRQLLPAWLAQEKKSSGSGPQVVLGVVSSSPWPLIRIPSPRPCSIRMRIVPPF